MNVKDIVSKVKEFIGNKVSDFKELSLTKKLILVIVVFGLIDLMFPQGTFSANGLGVVIISIAIIAAMIALYYTLFAKSYTGANVDEID